MVARQRIILHVTFMKTFTFKKLLNVVSENGKFISLNLNMIFYSVWQFSVSFCEKCQNVFTGTNKHQLYFSPHIVVQQKERVNQSNTALWLVKSLKTAKVVSRSNEYQKLIDLKTFCEVLNRLASVVSVWAHSHHEGLKSSVRSGILAALWSAEHNCT